MEFAVILAALTAFAGVQDPGQVPPSEPTQLEDVEVTAAARADMARTFVNRVAAPARGRGLGKWRSVCPGIANLDRAVAQPIADRIAQRAADLGIEVEEPGCEANIIIVFAADAPALTDALVEADPLVFQHGGGGIDRGTAALRDFRASRQPVRWWSLNLPIDSQTGQRAVRARGDMAGGPVSPKIARMLGCNVSDCVGAGVPVISVFAASRLNSQIVDQIYKSIVIVDIEAVAGLSTAQLADYLAMVSLSQVDPEADTGAFDTVLNLFSNPSGVTGLTDWDLSYLSALYNSPSQRRNVGAQADAVAAIMVRDARADAAD